jgi:hypothetical protein
MVQAASYDSGLPSLVGGRWRLHDCGRYFVFGSGGQSVVVQPGELRDLIELLDDGQRAWERQRPGRGPEQRRPVR